MHDLDFRDLSYAIAVKQQRGFTAAAIVLGLDQGYLSRKIRALERRLGFTLFERRPFQVTAAGQAFLTRAEQTIAQMQRAIELAQEIENGTRGQIDIGINTSIANSRLSSLLKTFCDRFPHINVALHERPSYEQIKLLQQQQLDMGFFHRHSLQNVPQSDRAALKTIPILTEPLVAVLPKGHRLAGHKTVALAALKGDRFVLPPRQLLYGLRERIDQLLVMAGCQPQVVQEAAWITTVLSLVAGNVGVSLLPANVKTLQRQGVVYCDIHPSLELELVAVSHRDNPSATLRHLTQTLASSHSG